MTHKWNYLPITPEQAETSQTLARELGVVEITIHDPETRSASLLERLRLSTSIRGGVLEKLVIGDNGETFLSNLESAGFYDQFVGKEVSSLDVMGADLVSGATKSSTAVRNGVNAAVEYYIEHASGGEA